MTVASPRVEALLSLYATLPDEQQSMVRDMVTLACHRVERQLLVRAS